MGYTKFADLSGAGLLDLTYVDTYGYWHTIVTDLGLSHQIESYPQPRYVDLGWISPTELDPDTGVGLSGYFPSQVRFLEFLQQVHDFHAFAVNIAGINYCMYSFRPGVVCDLYIWAP